MWVHFLYWHVLDTVVILEKGNLPHPRYTRCDILVPLRELNDRYPATNQCARGTERKRRRLVEAELRDILERSFEAYRYLLENVTSFRYLGWVLTGGYDDWLAVVGNLGKVRKSWGLFSWILNREGADTKVSGYFYKVVS